MIVRFQRLAFTGGAVLAVLALVGEELGAGGIVLALPALTALMGVLVGGLLWVWAAMISFDPPGEDDEADDGYGGPPVPEAPSAPPGSDWDRFDAERDKWARDYESTPV